VIEERAPQLEAYRKKRESIRRHVEALGAPRREVPARTQPFMLATLADRPPSGEGWLFEIKFDGIRVLAARRGAGIELYGRSGQLITGRYPDLVRALLALPVEQFLIDGEIVALDESGRPSFQRLQPRMALTNPREIEGAAARIPVEGVFFDCLALGGHDLRRLPLTQRKECLRLLVPPLGPVHYVDHVEGDGQAFLEAASEQRLEGIVAKRAGRAYDGGRSRDWIKIKSQRGQEFVIGGYTDPQGSRGHFGALHLGLYDDGRLTYVSKVGTGFDEAGLKSLWEKLQPLARATPPFDTGEIPKGRSHHWVEPKLVCDVRFSDWTEDGGIRHPIFMRLRSDKRPEDCRREAPLALPRNDAGTAVPAAPPPAARGDEERTVKLTNLKKIFWPADGSTKGDLVAYYDRVAPLILPYLRDRPLVLTRYPDGITGKSFFQKDAPEFTPAWVRTERVYSKDAGRDIDYFVVDDAASLRYVANSAAIPLHLWASRLASLERPDWLVLDLDPKGAPFTDVVKVAQALHRILDDLELPSYPKTSGATGLHLLIPLGARYTYDEVRTFARLLAVLGVEAEPAISTIARPLRNRGGKVYIDFGQNGHGQTIVAPYSLRPLPGAPASCPLTWSEVTARLDPMRFTMTTLPKRFDKMADPLAPVLTGVIDMAAAVARIERRLGEPPGEGTGTVKDSRSPRADARRRGPSRPPRA
jgi:bifunctional non-homologous end joining protein LigD